MSIDNQSTQSLRKQFDLPSGLATVEDTGELFEYKVPSDQSLLIRALVESLEIHMSTIEQLEQLATENQQLKLKLDSLDV